MTSQLPRLFLVRHGDTAWTESRQHTGRTDLPLNAHGMERARAVGENLRRFSFQHIFSSPLQRAWKTCELAGFSGDAVLDQDLLEWDYGLYEGKLTTEILNDRPGWELYRDGCPDGETPQDVANRADRFIRSVRDLRGDVIAFSSGHIIRMIAARWLKLPPEMGRCFFCRPGSVGVLAFEHDRREEPIVGLWNYGVAIEHLAATTEHDGDVQRTEVSSGGSRVSS